MTEFFRGLLEGGDITTVAIVAVGVIGGLLLERVALTAGWRVYFRLGMPLGEDLVPIPLAPEGKGKTASVRWAVDEEAGFVRFWAQPGARSAPMGLRGVLGLVRSARGIHLPVRWSPPFTPFLALLWFAALGFARGQGLITIPIAGLIMAALIVVYRQAALRAARELRWAFVSGEEGAPEP